MPETPNRVRAPDGFADLTNVVLPARACLLSVSDLLCPTRRDALADSVSAARRTLTKASATQDLRCVAALQAMWDAVSAMELAANTAAPWVDPQIQGPNGSWVEMTRYDAGRATRFYESSHKWTDERFAVVSGHRFRHGEDGSMLELMRKDMGIDDRLANAFAEAQAATSAFLRRRFEVLAGAWKSMRAYAAAYEHGLLHIPSDFGAVVDADEEVIPHAILVWETRKDASRGEVGDSVSDAVDAAEQAGGLAIDLVSQGNQPSTAQQQAALADAGRPSGPARPRLALNQDPRRRSSDYARGDEHLL